MSDCPECGMRDDDWFLCRKEDCATKTKPDDKDARIAALEAQLAERVKGLDPDMPAQQLRMHLGEMTAQELRTARAAIRLANSALSALEARYLSAPRIDVEALMQGIEDIMIDAEVDFPAGQDAGPRVQYDDEAIRLLILSALSGDAS